MARAYTLHATSPAVAIATALDATLIVGRRSDLLLQAVVELGERTEDGHVIDAVTPAWFEIARLLRSDPSVLHQIGPRKMEEMIAGVYERDGYEVTLTPQSGDYGRDVIAVKKGRCCVRILGQVKAYRPGHLVLADDIRALLGVLSGDRNATKGVVTTTSDFAPRVSSDPSIAPFVPYRLQLVNGAELRTWFSELSQNQTIR